MSKQDGTALLSRRYAKALFALAQASGAVDAVLKNVEGLKLACENATLQSLMQSPLVRKTAQLKAVEGLKSPLGLHALTVRFLQVLVENRRLAALPQVLEHFVELARAARGEALVVVTSAKQLDDAARRTLHTALEKKLGKIALEEKVDASLLAGMIVRRGSHRLDASLKGRLQQLKHALA